MTELDVLLPWPPRVLAPNARAHWQTVRKAKRLHRAACWWRVIEAEAQRSARSAALPCASLCLVLSFAPPDARRRDLDNLFASMKAGLDGVFDALQVDDSLVREAVLSFVEPVVGGRVRLQLRPR